MRRTPPLKSTKSDGSSRRSPRGFLPLVGTAVLLVATGCGKSAKDKAVEDAQAQVRRMAADLDKRTTETGAYIRAKDGEIQETDPWGTPIEVDYSQGGVAETLTVRSAGPDRKFHTDDDLVAQGMSANMKGIGEGVKKNAEETASNAAKGAVKGTVDGVKDSIKNALPFRKSKKSKRKRKDAPVDDNDKPDEKADEDRCE